MGLRASEEEEDEGLDEPEHGALAYPEMAPQTGGIAPDPAGAD
jgi:ammonia channel protein AmtB